MSVGVFFKGVKEGMHLFGGNIAIIVNTTLLFIAYVFGIGLTSLIAKISGKKFLEMRIEKDSGSYWKPLNLKKKSMEEYYRQF